jgi:hypothetical protein
MAFIDGKHGADAERSSRRILTITALLYAAACILPATDIGSFGGGALSDGPVDRSPTFGWEHLLFGWMDYFRSLPPWTANFVMLAGAVQLQRARLGSATALGFLSVGLGLTTLTSYKHDTRYVGYYLWQSSQAALAIGSLAIWLRVRGCANRR